VRISLIVLLLLIFNPFNELLSAQTSNSIQGLIRDSLNNTPIPFANVLIAFKTRPDSSIGGVSSLNDGHFSFFLPANTLVDTLLLKISSIGYRAKRYYVLPTAWQTSIDIALNKELVNINEVVVYSYRENLKTEVDQLTYFVKDDSTMQDKSGLDAITKVPFIWFSSTEKKINYKFNKKLLVLLNGKYYETFQDNTSALQAIPAKLIEKIELLSDPGPKYRDKYDAAVNVTTKGYLHGFTANASSNSKYVAQKVLANNSIFIFLQQYKLGVQANISQSTNYSSNTVDYRSAYLGHKSIQQSTNYAENVLSPSYTGSLIFDLELHKAWSVNLYGSYDRYRPKGESTGSYFSMDELGNNRFNTLTSSLSRVPSSEIGLRLNKTYTSSKHFLSFSARQILSQPYENINQQRNSATVSSVLRTFNQIYSKDLALESVYSKPLSASLTWESTAAYVLRQYDNQFRFDSLNQAISTWQNIAGLNQTQNYNQEIGRITEGLRLRTSKLSINFILNLDHSHYATLQSKQNYWNFYPSFRLRSKPSRKGSLVFDMTYRRAIRRPTAQLVNAYIDIQDPFTVQTGNSQLTQRSEQLLSFGLEGMAAKNRINYYNTFEINLAPKNFSLYTRYDSVQKRSVVTYFPVGRTNYYTLITGGGFRVNNHLSLQVTNLLNYIHFNNLISQQINQGIFDQFNFSLNANSLWKNYNLTFLYTWFSKSPSIQGSETYPSSYVLAFGRNLWKNKGGVLVSAQNFLLTRQSKKTIIDEPLFQRNNNSTFLGRVLVLSFFYRFANLQVGGPAETKRISNMDLQGLK
jgi:hypothetical protein